LIVDFNAYLGPFAFRRLRHQTAAELLRLMDAKGIDRAVVSSAAAITYRNAQAGNEDLADEVGAARDRLIPFAVINPSYAGWRDDLKACHERMGMKGVRLYPHWHRYTLDSSPCRDLIDEATGRRMAVSIPVRVEDPRQRSWLVDVPDVALADLAALVKACPDARFHLLNGIGYLNSPLGRKDNGLPENYCIEISRLNVLLNDEVEQLVANLGPDRVVFGTGMPFSYPDPAFAKIEVLAPDADVKEKILWRNAAKWL
jgi:predicted TIM-barrel fold metal-dependent hydrolase